MRRRGSRHSVTQLRRVQLSVHVRAYVHEAISTRRSARVHLSVRTYAYVRNVCFNRYVRVRTCACGRCGHSFGPLVDLPHSLGLCEHCLQKKRAEDARTYVRTPVSLNRYVRSGTLRAGTLGDLSGLRRTLCERSAYVRTYVRTCVRTYPLRSLLRATYVRACSLRTYVRMYVRT